MTLEVLKSKAVKLQRAELFEFVQFIIETLEEKEGVEIETPDWLKAEIRLRANDMKSGKEKGYSARQVQDEINKEFGFDLTVPQFG